MKKIPEGWPTREMVNAAWHEIFGKPRLETNGTERITYALTAALAAAPTPPAPNEDSRFGAVATIMQDVCETEPANPDLPDTVCINVDDLKSILDDHIKTPPAPEVEPVAYRANKKLKSGLIEESILTSQDDLASYRDCGFVITPLYTHPSDDGLWKVAEDALGVLEDFNASETDIARVIKNLRLELDKG